MIHPIQDVLGLLRSLVLDLDNSRVDLFSSA